MLSSQQLQLITELLDDEKSTLDSISNNCRANQTTKQNLFSLCSALHLLLQDNLLIYSHQKIIAYYLLYDLHQVEIVKNPFFPIFYESAKNQLLDAWQRNYCRHIIHGIGEEASKKTSIGLLEWLEATECVEYDIEAQLALYLSNFPKFGAFKKSGVFSQLYINNGSSTLPTNPQTSISHHSSSVNQIQSPHATNSVKNFVSAFGDTILSDFLPFIVRPCPPILEPSKDESIWLYPLIPFSPPTAQQSRNLWFEWDSSIGKNSHSNENHEALALLDLAFTQPLSRDQITKLITELRACPEMLRDSNFSPHNLGQLVECNPKVAIQALVELVQCFGSDLGFGPQRRFKIADYWTQLVNINVSKHSMEVVSSICTAIELPVEYLHLYVSNCIRTCQTTKDHVVQHRLVAMCCVFLQTLIRSKILNVADVFSEVESFCVSFSRVHEAATLFRLLKQLH